MNFKRKFKETAAYLNEYMPDVQNLDSDISQFFLNLSDDSIHALRRGYSIYDIGAPKNVIEMEEAAREVSWLPFVYNPASDMMTSHEKAFFKNTKNRKIDQVYNFTNVFASYKDAAGVDFIVDMACGIGHLGRYMALKFPDVPVLGVDKNEEFISIANERIDGVHGNLEFAVGDAYESYDSFMLGENNAVVSLHGCGTVTHSVLSADDAKLVAASPCCYIRLEPDEYFMSEYAKKKDLQFIDDNTGTIANLGPGTLLPKLTEKKRRGVAEKISKNGYKLDLKETELLQSMGLDYHANESNVDYIADSIHNLKMRHSMLKKIVYKPIEAMFSADKAISLQERGYDAKVLEYVPVVVTPRNHLVLGYK